MPLEPTAGANGSVQQRLPGQAGNSVQVWPHSRQDRRTDEPARAGQPGKQQCTTAIYLHSGQKRVMLVACPGSREM